MVCDSNFYYFRYSDSLGGTIMWKIKFINDEIISDLQCKWTELPQIPIKEFYYNFSNNQTLYFTGFDSYICFKEIYKLFDNSATVTDTINILAKYNENVCQISYNPIHSKIMQRKNTWGKEFTPLIWKPELQQWGLGKARITNRDLWKVGQKSTKGTIKLINTDED